MLISESFVDTFVGCLMGSPVLLVASLVITPSVRPFDRAVKAKD